VVDALIAEAVKAGDEPSVVGEAIVAAATDSRPKLRYPAGPLARRVTKLRRYAPPTMFDKQIRKINQLNGPASTTVPSPERQTSSGQSCICPRTEPQNALTLLIYRRLVQFQ